MFSVYIYIYSFWWSNPLYPPPMISWFVQVIKKKSVYLSFFLVSSKFWTPPKSSPGWRRCCIRLELANFQLCHITLVYWRIACCCIVVYSYIFVRVKLILENFFAWQCPKCYIAVCSITVEAFPYLPLIMSMSGRNFYDQMSNVYESVPLLFATDHVIFLLFRFRNFLGPNEQTQPGLFFPFLQYPSDGKYDGLTSGVTLHQLFIQVPKQTAWNWTVNHWYWLSNGFSDILLLEEIWQHLGCTRRLKTCKKWDEVSTSTSARISEGSRVFA